MKKVCTALLTLTALAAAATASAATYTVQFDNNYVIGADANIVTPNAYMTAGGLRFSDGEIAGGGVSLSNVLGTGEYTIDTTFSLNYTSYWRKLVDFKDSASDNGLYSHDGRLSFVRDGLTEEAGAATVLDGQSLRLTLTRDAGNVFTAYVNGLLQFSFNDVAGDSVFSGAGQVARFFLDDLVTSHMGHEGAPGIVQSITVYDTALSAQAVQSLGGPLPAVPEPATGVLTVAGLLAAATLARRRRHNA